jgi:hypothetical protein
MVCASKSVWGVARCACAKGVLDIFSEARALRVQAKKFCGYREGRTVF